MSSRLPDRKSRGKRVHKLVGEELEADELFWNQDAFEEEGEDEDFSSTETEEDEVDSDFDAPEDYGTQEAAAPEPVLDDVSRKKRNVYVDPATLRHKAAAPRPAAPKRTAKPVQPLTPAQRNLRASTAERVNADESRRKAEEERKQAITATKGYDPVAAAAAKKEETTFSQEHMLLEAVETAEANLHEVKEMARVEETRHVATGPKRRRVGRRVRYHSKQGEPTTLTFTEVEEFPHEVDQAPEDPPAKPTCVVTGLPARYLDPVTELPFATAEAFKVIRAHYAEPEHGAEGGFGAVHAE